MSTPKYATIVWPEHLKGQQVEIVDSPADGVYNTVNVVTGEAKVFHADNLAFTEGKTVNADSLNSVMEFDHVIRVHADGTVSDSPLSPYFDLHVVEVSEGLWEDEFSIPEGWELLRGFSGQHSYSGPVMHASEFLGGGMARHILETPGDYVALTVESYDIHCEDCAEFEYEQGEPAGWAVAFKPLEG